MPVPRIPVISPGHSRSSAGFRWQPAADGPMLGAPVRPAPVTMLTTTIMRIPRMTTRRLMAIAAIVAVALAFVLRAETIAVIVVLELVVWSLWLLVPDGGQRMRLLRKELERESLYPWLLVPSDGPERSAE